MIRMSEMARCSSYVRCSHFFRLSTDGQMVENTWPAGLREPMNLIISANSDKRVLNPSTTDGGLYNYFEAFHYGGQCLGLHMGNKQVADLGSGNREFRNSERR